MHQLLHKTKSAQLLHADLGSGLELLYLSPRGSTWVMQRSSFITVPIG